MNSHRSEIPELCEWSDLPRSMCAHCLNHHSDHEPIALPANIRQHIHGYVLDLSYQAVRYHAPGRLPKRPDDEDRYLSTDQIDHLAATLRDVPQLLEDLDIAITKDVRFPTRTVHGDGTEAAIVFNTSASYASNQLRTAVTAAAIHLWNHLTPGTRHSLHDPLDAAEWLHNSLRKLALVPDAETSAKAISRAADRAMRVIDHPREVGYLGQCPKCGADLEAEAGSQYVVCQEPTGDDICGWTAQVDQVIRGAIVRSRDRLFTDSELVGVFRIDDGRDVTRNQINSWARSGRLTPHEEKRWDKHAQKIVSRRTYRLSEVQQLVDELQRKRETA